MRVDTQRRIDKWLGIPACAGFSLWNRLFGRGLPPQPPRNVLIIQLSEMGSLALAYPAVCRLRHLWPQARVRFLVFERNRAFMDLLDIVEPEDVWTLDDSSIVQFGKSVRAFMRRARREQIDTTLDFEIFARASVILSLLSGASRRAGFDNYRAEGLYRGRLLTHPVYYNTHQHISNNFLAMVEVLQQDRPEQPAVKQVLGRRAELPKIASDPDKARAMRERLMHGGHNPEHRLLVVSPFSGNLLPIRAWPAQHYVTLLHALLHDYHDMDIAVMGLPEAQDYCNPIFEELDSKRVIDFIGQTRDVGEVINLLNIADLFITSDSGPPHFASLTQTPTLVMFGPECPMLYGPLGRNVHSVYLGMHCSPCVSAFNHRDTPCTNNRCMQDITPDMILERAHSLL